MIALRSPYQLIFLVDMAHKPRQQTFVFGPEMRQQSASPERDQIVVQTSDTILIRFWKLAFDPQGHDQPLRMLPRKRY